MLYEIKDGTVSQGGQVILSHFDFGIRGTEKIAIVGKNGAGKTTLLDVIAGEKELDSNEKNQASGVNSARSFSIGVLRQKAVDEPDKTVEDSLLEAAMAKHGMDIDIMSPHSMSLGGADLYSKERFDFEQRYDRIFTEFGFSLEDKKKKLGEFSGGEQTKIMLIRLLLSEPDVLILDEPTNHLDVTALEWLEEHLKSYKGAVVMVSHDRYFIDQVAEEIWEVTGQKTYHYTGNYTAYREQKSANFAKAKKAYESQQAEVERLNGLIDKFKHKPRKAAFARSRAKILERMELMDKPTMDDAVIHTGDIFPERLGSKNVFECKDLLIGYQTSIKEISFRIRRGQKIGVIGPNGTGKSTFLKTIAGQQEPLKGKMTIGENVDVAYFDQMSAAIDSDKKVIDYFHDEFPSMLLGEVRNTLAGFLFRGDDMGKKVSSLSGGEKARLVLAVLLQRKPNFLIMDEPTNNMDIPAKETLESIFRDYKGTILFVSHDRYFLSRVAQSLLVFEADTQQVMFYPSDYAHYRENRRRAESGIDADLLRTAEEQRLIEGLRNVPKGETGMLRQISQLEAEFDWRFELNHRVRVPAREAYEAAYLAYTNVPDTELEYQDYLQRLPELAKNLAEAEESFTQAVIEWYDIWQEQEEIRGDVGDPAVQ